jgi:PIN domain
VLPFDVPADAEYGGIRSELEAAGRPIGSNDMLIAAHAYATGATIVTANADEFKRIRGLQVENWLALRRPPECPVAFPKTNAPARHQFLCQASHTCLRIQAQRQLTDGRLIRGRPDPRAPGCNRGNRVRITDAGKLPTRATPRYLVREWSQCLLSGRCGLICGIGTWQEEFR